MSNIKLTGRGYVADADYKFIKWIGHTKSHKAVEIVMPVAFCRSNPDWTFAEKDDVVPELEFEGVYDDDKLAENDRTEPWTITIEDGVNAGNDEILLGVGKFYVGPAGATEYSTSKTYALNDLVMHDNKIYKCTTAITGSGETWTAAHWHEEGPMYVGLTRGGGSFVVEREYREINADEDPGAVKDRMEQESGRPKLKLNALQWLTKITDLYAGFETVTN